MRYFIIKYKYDANYFVMYLQADDKEEAIDLWYSNLTENDMLKAPTEIVEIYERNTDVVL
jgi:hypothetical protein